MIQDMITQSNVAAQPDLSLQSVAKNYQICQDTSNKLAAR